MATEDGAVQIVLASPVEVPQTDLLPPVGPLGVQRPVSEWSSHPASPVTDSRSAEPPVDMWGLALHSAALRCLFLDRPCCEIDDADVIHESPRIRRSLRHRRRAPALSLWRSSCAFKTQVHHGHGGLLGSAKAGFERPVRPLAPIGVPTPKADLGRLRNSWMTAIP